MRSNRYVYFFIGVLGFFALAVTWHVGKAGTKEAKIKAMSAALFSPAANYVVHDFDTSRAESLRCLAMNVYWEARSEPVDGQLAVAAVTMNRVAANAFPDDVCGVVRQGGEIRRYRCQFSWWCDGKRDVPLEMTAWRRAETIARLTLLGVISDPTQGSLWYHADYVEPKWASQKHPSAKIGRHIFYTLKPAGEIEVSENADQDNVVR